MTLFYLIFLVFLLFYLLIEYLLIFKSLRKIPLRILVNGTRGKSTTVKIIHKILRQAEQKVFAKITGEQPSEILPDGQVKILARYAPASIIENVRILRRWARKSPDAVVLECMALQPETQHTLARRIFQPNHILITNIYPDHKEVMGQHIGEMAATIFQCIPGNAHIFVTGETARLLETRGEYPEKLSVALPEISPEKFDFIPAEVINPSWSLIRALAQQLKIDPQVVHRCFREVWLSLDREICITDPGRQWSLWNLFPVNDPYSAKAIIMHNNQKMPKGVQEIVLFNTRSDRPLRTVDFVNLVKQEFPSADVWLTGSGRRLARQLFQKSPLNSRLVQLMGKRELLQKLQNGFNSPTVIYGIGNYSGMKEIVERIRENLQKGEVP